MTISVVTIALCGILVIMAIASFLCNGLLRRPCRNMITETPNRQVPFSIIIIAHNNANELERNLPLLLQQEYDSEFELIVVDESSTDDTEDVLKRIKHTHPNLYTTFIPETSHYLSRRKLALTIGVKAAHKEWIIFTDADCKPVSNQWLQTISRSCDDEHDIVLGYTNYEPAAKCYHRFERMLMSCYMLRTAQRGTAYCYNGNCLALRKSVFMSHNGFLKNLRYLRGEYDFMVNEFSRRGRTAVVTEVDGRVCQDAPTNKMWANNHVYYMETRKHLMRSFPYRALFNTDMTFLHINYMIQIAAVVYSFFIANYLIGVTAAVAFFMTVTLRMAIAGKTLKFFGEHIPLWRVPLMEIRVVWQNMLFMLWHKCSDKYDFIRK